MNKFSPLKSNAVAGQGTFSDVQFLLLFYLNLTNRRKPRKLRFYERKQVKWRKRACLVFCEPTQTGGKAFWMKR